MSPTRLLDAHCQGETPGSAKNRLSSDSEFRECPVEETEAYRVLLSRAERKTGAIPAQLLVKHVLGITLEADWPVQREAMEALLRRYSFGRRG